MPKQNEQKYTGWLPVILLATGIFLLVLLWKVLYLFVLAALLAFIIHPLVDLLDRKFPRGFSIASVFLVLIILLIVVIGLLAPIVADQTQQLIRAFPGYLDKAREFTDSFRGRFLGPGSRWQGFANSLITQLQQSAASLAQSTLPAVLSFFTSLFTLVLVPLLAFYMLLGQKDYKATILSITPGPHKETVDRLLHCTGDALWTFLKGQSILMLAVGLLVGFGLYIVGMPYPALFGVIAGLLELIPNFGPLTTTVIVALVGFLISPWLGVKGIIVTTGVQLLENTFLSPYIMAKAVGLNPVTIIFSIFLGAALAGVLGAIIAVPIATIVKIVILYFYASESDLPGRKVCRTPEKKS
jgi:predicted PurR-regulated permease PerM